MVPKVPRALVQAELDSAVYALKCVANAPTSPFNVSQMPLPAHLLEEFHACQRLDGRKRINFDQMSFNRNLLFRYS